MILSSVKNQFKAHPITTFLVVLGLAISILIISVGVSGLKKANLILQEQIHYAPQNAIRISFEFQNKQEFNRIFKTFDGISDNSGVIIDQIMMLNEGLMSPVIPEYWTKQVFQRFPIEEGRYLNVRDIQNGEKVALVGKSRLKDLLTINDEQYIILENVRYKVVGVIGVKEKPTNAIDEKIVIPATALPQNILSKLQSSKKLNVIIHNSFKDTYSDEKRIKKNTQEIFSEATVTATPYGTGSIPNLRLGDEVYLSILVYILAIINAINLTAFWINERKYEIGIKKAFGYSNFDIISLLFGEMCVISFLSVFIGFTMQIIISSLIEKMIDYPIEISATHLFIAIMFVITSSSLTTAIPAFKAMKIQPVEAIKG